MWYTVYDCKYKNTKTTFYEYPTYRRRTWSLYQIPLATTYKKCVGEFLTCDDSSQLNVFFIQVMTKGFDQDR